MTSGSDLEARVATLERECRRLRDIEAIKDMKARYWHYLDSRQWKGLEEIFARDAEIDYGYGLCLKGGKVIARGLGLMTAKSFTVTVHQGHNPEIEPVSDEAARGRWQFDQFGIENGSNKIVRIGGSYDDEYVRENGAWKIRKSKVNHIYWQVLDAGEFKNVDGAADGAAGK